MDEKCTDCTMIIEAGARWRYSISGRPFCHSCYHRIMWKDRFYERIRTAWGEAAILMSSRWHAFDGDSGSEGYAK